MCVTSKRVSGEKHKTCEIFSKNIKQSVSTSCHSPSIIWWGQRPCDDNVRCKKGVEGDAPIEPKGEPDLDNCNDQVDFNPEQRFSTTKVIIELTNLLKGSCLAKRRLVGGNKFEDSAKIFYEKDQQDIPSHHNRPLYVTVSVRDVELKRAMTDLRSSLNIISLFMLQAVRMRQDIIRRGPIEVSDFIGYSTWTLGSWI